MTCELCNDTLVVPIEGRRDASAFCPTCVPVKLARGRTYRAKTPRRVSDFTGDLVNDRTIIFMGDMWVQYDGPAVRQGAHYPKVTLAQFVKWVDRDVTDELPEGAYATWPPVKVKP